MYIVAKLKVDSSRDIVILDPNYITKYVCPNIWNSISTDYLMADSNKVEPGVWKLYKYTGSGDIMNHICSREAAWLDYYHKPTKEKELTLDSYLTAMKRDGNTVCLSNSLAVVCKDDLDKALSGKVKSHYYKHNSRCLIFPKFKGTVELNNYLVKDPKNGQDLEKVTVVLNNESGEKWYISE